MSELTMFDHSGTGILSMIAGSGPVVILVLSVLTGFSITSWAIIAWKFGQIRRSMKESRDFLDAFFDLQNSERLVETCEKYRYGSLPRVFRAGSNESNAIRDRFGNVQKKDRIMLVLKRAVNAESKRLSHMVPFLATVGNTAPFIGLFGTVWGIMTSFQNIGLMKSASLAAVAPGISEALVATATGLVAAIPSVMGYNYLTHQISLIERDLEDFVPDFTDSYLKQ
jgi:biopolymer transport protein TolQ